MSTRRPIRSADGSEDTAMEQTRAVASAPTFTDVHRPAGAPRGLVLVLHGGAEHSEEPVDRRSLSWWRGRALARAAAAGLRDDGVGVALLRYRVKGWNAGRGGPSPVPDARWALDALPKTLAGGIDLPVAILGHSMGARTGVAVADHPSVRGVVALAPWLPADEPTAPLAGKVLHAAHGSRDRITSPRATRRFVARASEVAAASYADMGPVGHYLLRDVEQWNTYAVSRLREILSPGG